MLFFFVLVSLVYEAFPEIEFDIVSGGRCDTCNRGFFSEKNRKIHVKLAHQTEYVKYEKKFKCFECLERFFSLEILNEHLKSEHDVVCIHQCKECGQSFQTGNYIEYILPAKLLRNTFYV